MTSRALPFMLVLMVLPGTSSQSLAEDAASAPRVRASARISSAILAGLPTYSSLPEPERPEAPLDAVAMPLFVVRSDKSGLGGSDMMTKVGLKALFAKLYPGASVPGPDVLIQVTPNYADLMHRDAQRIQAKAAMLDLSAAVHASGQTDEAKALDKEILRTFMRPHNWRDEGLDKSLNAYRR